MDEVCGGRGMRIGIGQAAQVRQVGVTVRRERRWTSPVQLPPGNWFAPPGSNLVRGEDFGVNAWSATEYDRDTDRSCRAPLFSPIDSVRIDCPVWISWPV
jgi:hypothetical protein